MKFTPIPFAGAFLIDLEKREDDRGFFARCFCEQEFKANGLATHWVQINTSFNRQKGALRGLHFQRPPKAEAKMVRCLRGAIWDVIVDLRKGSDTFGRWFSTELNEENRTMMYVPQGFAHGYQTLKNNTELLYLHSKAYSPAHEGGVRFDDPTLGIKWPIAIKDISARDRGLPLFRKLLVFEGY